MVQQETNRSAVDFTFHIERTFDVPREKMWKLWTDAEKHGAWFGPKGANVTIRNFDIRPGGEVFYCIEMDGNAKFAKWLFQQVNPNEKLVALIIFTDDQGENIIEHPFMPDWPLKILSEVLFTQINGKTKVSINWHCYEADQIQYQAFINGASSMQEGWTGTFERLEDYIQKGLSA